VRASKGAFRCAGRRGKCIQDKRSIDWGEVVRETPATPIETVAAGIRTTKREISSTHSLQSKNTPKKNKHPPAGAWRSSAVRAGERHRRML